VRKSFANFVAMCSTGLKKAHRTDFYRGLDTRARDSSKMDTKTRARTWKMNRRHLVRAPSFRGALVFVLFFC
jgi:hypothetical protein